MTDFSDRLDSIVSGKVTELYERINLFLIVGIAGTLFGVFEFSLRGADALRIESIGDERAVTLGRVLSESLAKAFPVGFVGLGLMFAGQLIVSFYENRLKQAVVDATQAALRRRMEVTHEQGASLTAAVRSFERATQPLADFQTTLAKGLEPVARELGGRLEQSLTLVRLQFDELQGTTKEFGNSVDVLNDIVGGLGSKTDALGQALTGVPPLLSGLTDLQANQSEALTRFQENLRESLKATQQTVAAAQVASEEARELPRRIGEAAESALKTLSAEVAEIANNISRELQRELQESARVQAEGSTKIAQELSSSMKAATSQLQNDLTAGSEALFTSVTGQSKMISALIEKAAREVSEVVQDARNAVVGLEAIRATVTEQSGRYFDNPRRKVVSSLDLDDGQART